MALSGRTLFDRWMTPRVTFADQVSEAALLLGAGAAVMNQLAMLGVGLGVAEHSTTLERPVDRLRTTLTYVYGIALGTDEERRLLGRLVTRAHAPVRSEGRYSAFDPDLQLWVAATLIEMGGRVFDLTFGPRSDEDAEGIYREAQVLGTALQVRPEAWPATQRGFEEYWAESLTRLSPDPTVQQYAAALLDRERAPWLFTVLLPLQDLMTRGLVPRETRDALALSWTRRDQRRFDLFWTVFPPVYRRTPRILRTLPARLYLRDFRRRMAQSRRVI
jgi:uncharacterized protein (DUF2236 family)